MFSATMAAAFLGNTYYHILAQTTVYYKIGPIPAFHEIISYLFYAFLLGICVSVSLVREQKRRGKPKDEMPLWKKRLTTFRKIAGVWLFFSIIRIWGNTRITVFEETAFFFSLFGISI